MLAWITLGLSMLGTAAPQRSLPVPVDGTVARRHVHELSALGARVAATSNELKAAEYIENAFRSMGYAPVTQPFSLAGRPVRRSSNVMALKQGVSPRTLIVGAHYDSEARGSGADDNASGVGVLLEVAAAVRNVSTPYTIRFVAFGAEEADLQGSTYFVQQMNSQARRNTVGMINIDSLTAGDFAYVYGDRGARGGLRDWLLALAAREGLDVQTQPGLNPMYPAGTTGDFSDHAPFRRAGIPYVYFESTNWTLGDKDGYTQVSTSLGERGHIWHTRYDTIEYIEATFPGRMSGRLKLFTTLLYRLLTEFVQPN